MRQFCEMLASTGAPPSEASSYPAVADAPAQSQEDSDDPFDDLDGLVVDDDEELAPAAPQDGEFPRGSAPAHAQPTAVAAAAQADPGIAELESAANRQLPPQAPPPAPTYTADGENIAVGAEFGTLQVRLQPDHIFWAAMSESACVVCSRGSRTSRVVAIEMAAGRQMPRRKSTRLRMLSMLSPHGPRPSTRRARI